MANRIGLSLASAAGFMRRYLSFLLGMTTLVMFVVLLEFRSSLIEAEKIQTKQLELLTTQLGQIQSRQAALEEVMYIVNGTMQAIWDRRMITDTRIKQLRDKADAILMNQQREHEGKPLIRDDDGSAGR